MLRVGDETGDLPAIAVVFAPGSGCDHGRRDARLRDRPYRRQLARPRQLRAEPARPRQHALRRELGVDRQMPEVLDSAYDLLARGRLDLAEHDLPRYLHPAEIAKPQGGDREGCLKL